MNIKHESFGLPFNLTQIESLYGYPLYSSNKVKSIYKNIIKKGNLKSVYNKIENLIDDNILLPVYADKHVIAYLKNKMIGTRLIDDMMGAYIPEKNKVYIIMNNNTRFLFWMKEREINETTMHELVHYVAYNKPNAFYSIFKNELFEFYKTLFDITFNSVNVLSDSACKKLLTYLHKNFENKHILNRNSLYKYAEFLETIIKSDNGDTKDYILNLITPLKIYLDNPQLFITLLRNNEKIRVLVGSLYRAYKEIGIATKSMPIQEIIFPSEIISNTVHDLNNKHIKLIKSI